MVNCAVYGCSNRTRNSPNDENFQRAARDKGFPEDCEFVIEVQGGGAICSIKELDETLRKREKECPQGFKLSEAHGRVGQRHVLLRSGGACRGVKISDRNCISERLHWVDTPCASKVRLSGYGVELAIKSTEYKAQDDTKVKEEKNVVDSEEVEKVENMEGFDIKKLNPELKKEVEDNQHVGSF
ncbi:hypothetical protein HPB52_016338 [Rhipicephalus sanguineus]|uniref:Uncharacterized protein n=1 Tax=Rhipicephalus sanguineus TaxID=34632 RepID=A0A9D4Q0Z6_RHISA|nr:hypothetical protein HPB52_016338 [Rhipicephalus sanguineus]